MSEKATQLVNLVMMTTMSLRREEIGQLLYRHAQGRVMTGAFAGMQVLEKLSWDAGDMAAKIIGSYESDLHPLLDAIRSRPYSAIVNVGCAEGYYAVGLALRHPDIPVYAFDLDQNSQVICLETAFANGVGERFTLSGGCEPAALNEVLQSTSFPLIFLDCEGYEKTLLDLEACPGLIDADFIAEAHDFIDRSISRTLLERFGHTHDLQVIWEGGRNPNAYPALRSLTSMDRWIAVDENRPETMSWIAGLRKRG